MSLHSPGVLVRERRIFFEGRFIIAGFFGVFFEGVLFAGELTGLCFEGCFFWLEGVLCVGAQFLQTSHVLQ